MLYNIYWIRTNKFMEKIIEQYDLPQNTPYTILEGYGIQYLFGIPSNNIEQINNLKASENELIFKNSYKFKNKNNCDYTIKPANPFDHDSKNEIVPKSEYS